MLTSSSELHTPPSLFGVEEDEERERDDFEPPDQEAPDEDDPATAGYPIPGDPDGSSDD